MSLIAIDNAVELTIKTYLSLPKRVTGISVPRKRLEEIFESFPSLLDVLEECAADKLQGVDLASIEWYHRIRNQLYHQGFGLSVERDQVEIYAELANALFNKLFGTSVIKRRTKTTELLGLFFELWLRLENALANIASDHTLTGGRPRTLLQAATFLRNANILPDEDLQAIETFRRLRNEVVHGVTDYKQVLDQDIVNTLERLVHSLEEVTAEDMGWT